VRILCVFGRYNYGDVRRGEGYEYTNFIPALRRLGHEVLFFDSWDRTRYADFAALNRNLLEFAETERPDVILAVTALYEVWLETWRILNSVATTIFWATDDSWKYDQCSRFLAPSFGGAATTYPDALGAYARDGVKNVILTQWAASAETLREPLPASSCRYEVSFVGTAHGERPRLVADLKRRGVDVKCFGEGWPAGPVAAAQIPEIIRTSVISLNFSNATRVWKGYRLIHVPQLKARVFEIPGAGGFLLTQWSETLERYYEPGSEVAVFHDVENLASQIRHFIRNPGERDAIARAGFERTRRQHLYDQRMRELLGALIDGEAKNARRAEKRMHIDWDAFESAARRHKVDWKLRLLKRVLVGPCRLVWGGSRGKRAARRILFELSWRIVGDRVYSAAGWPGRLFFDVS
jgi:spore maturation protein CgeB